MISILQENKNLPQEGFFWIINDKIVGFAEEVPLYGYEYLFQGKTHENTWKSIINDYKINDKEVSFDNYPRGRVMVDPNYDNDNNFTKFSVMILMDPCLLKDDKYKQMILDYYNLDLPNCQIPMWPKLNDRAGINHYTCHNCKRRTK